MMTRSRAKKANALSQCLTDVDLFRSKLQVVMDLDNCMIVSSNDEAQDTSANLPSGLVVLDQPPNKPFRFYLRPGLADFLCTLTSFADVYAFTAGTEDYASKIFDYLDPTGQIFKKRWYRGDTCNWRKNLKRTMKDLFVAERTVLVDNSLICHEPQPTNAVFIRGYHCADEKDNELQRVLQLLLSIQDSLDVRDDLLVQWEDEALIRHVFDDENNSIARIRYSFYEGKVRYVVGSND